ncbi:MAG: sulfotransferase domain-containing protein [Anditalea sp.]
MKILQGGVPKCGNFWMYKIIQQVLHKTGGNTTSFIEQHPIYPLAKAWNLNFPDQARIDVLEINELQYSYRISSIFQMPIEDIKKYIDQTNHVWTHSPVCKKSGEVFNLFDKKVYIIRDPRDRAVSAAKYYCSDYMLRYFPQEEKDPKVFLQKNFDQLMQEWVWNVWDHLRLSQEFNIHIIFFENLLSDFQRELGRLLDYLELDLDPPQKEELENEVSFSTLKERNPKHLKKGTSGYWKEALSKEQIEKAAIIAEPLMQFLNYTTEGSPSVDFHPGHNSSIFEELKQEIILSQEPLY